MKWFVSVFFLFLINSVSAQGWIEIQKTLPELDYIFQDKYGTSVDMDGDYAIVGSPGQSFNTGGAFILHKDTNGMDQWGMVDTLTPSGTSQSFGRSVAISGDYAIVATQFESYSTFTSAGAAYIYNKNQGGPNNWGQTHRLVPSDAASGDLFGSSVSIHGDYAIIGAPKNGVGGSGYGKAYIFDVNTGGQIMRLVGTDSTYLDEFGISVAIQGNWAFVGGPVLNNGGSAQGSVFIFERNTNGPNMWGEFQHLVSTDLANYDYFGRCIALDGDTLVVGANNESSKGAAYLFYYNSVATQWVQFKKLMASDGSVINFGTSIDLDVPNVIIGCNFSYEGSFIFSQNAGSGWGEVVKLTASDAQAGDRFGTDVAIQGEYTAVGAPGDNGSTGATYIFKNHEIGGGVLDQCHPLSIVNISNALGNANEWVELLDGNGNLVAQVNANGNDLGLVSSQVYVDDEDIRTYMDDPYCRRDVNVTVATQPSDSASVRLFFIADEVQDLIDSVTGINTIEDVMIVREANPCSGAFGGSGDSVLNTTYHQFGSDYYIQFDVNNFSTIYAVGSPNFLGVNCDVTTTFDSGSGSLRDGIGCVSSGDTLFFDEAVNNDTIMLDSAIIIAKEVVLFAGLSQNIHLNGTSLQNTLNIFPGSMVTIHGLKIFGGNGPNGVVWNQGNLLLENVIISGDSTPGAIFLNEGILEIKSITDILLFPL